MSLSCRWTALHKKKHFQDISVQSWPADDVFKMLRQYIKRYSYRQIGLDILDIQFCLWIVLLMQIIFNISKRHLQKYTLAKQKEIQDMHKVW